MKSKLSVALAAIATIGLAATLSAAERPAWKFTEILSIGLNGPPDPLSRERGLETFPGSASQEDDSIANVWGFQLLDRVHCRE